MNGRLVPPGSQLQTGTSNFSTSPGAYNENFSSLYPNLSATQGQVSSNTLSRLRGELSPETLNAIQDTAARFGIGAGMPLGGGGNTVTANFGRKLVGQTVEGLQSQGLQDYLNTLQGYSGTLMATPGDIIGAETSRYGIDVGAATSRYGTDVGAATSRYGVDVGARTAANSLGEQARQFDFTFPESQRQFDTSSYLQNQQSNNQLEYNYAGLGQNYLNSYLQFLQ